MTPAQLFKNISSGKFKQLYYFYGSEDYRIAEAEKYTAHQFLPDRQASINYIRIDGRRTKFADLTAQLSAYPLLGERQLFCVDNFQSYKPTEIDRLLKILSLEDPNRITILSSPSSKAPKKSSAFIKKISAIAEVVEFNHLTTGEVSATVNALLNKAGLTIDNEALQMIVDLSAGNRGAIQNEVDKLINYVEAGGNVTKEDINAVGTGFQIHSIFELAEEIVRGDVKKVLLMVDRLLADGNSPTGMMFFLSQHFISLYLVKAGKPLEPYRRWLAGKFRNQAAIYNLKKLEKIIIDIAETDANVRKTGSIPAIELERLIQNLMETQK